MIDLFENALKQILPPTSPSPVLLEGARIALLAPGKRIRPLLTLHTAECLQPGSASRALHPACAVEIIHCSSLIHDDLPCMDDEDERRGQPTLHKIYNEGSATLIGDYLLTHAFDILSHAPSLSAEQRLALIQTLCAATGAEGLIGGQMMDLEQHSDIIQMNRRKTAFLFGCATTFGGIVVDTTQTIRTKLWALGLAFGELFQFVDDILDEEPYVDTSTAYQMLEALSHTAHTLIRQLPGDATPLDKLVDWVTQLVTSSTTSHPEMATSCKKN